MTDRLDRLDHLRAIAALLVVSWHLGTVWPHPPEFLSLLRQGHTGVSMFCVISGFILTTIYLPRDAAYFSFLRNRLLRIAPLFLFIAFLTFYATGWEAGPFLAAILAGLFRSGLPSFAAPGWTVIVEFQFYIIFPFLLIFAKREGAKYLLGLLITFLLVRAALWNATSTVQEISYYTIFGRMDQFLIGMIAGTLLPRGSVRNVLSKRYVSIPLLVAGVSTAIAFFWWFDAQGGLLNFTGGRWPNKSMLWIFMPSIEGVIFVAILLGYLHTPQIQGLRLLSKAIAFVGVVSYSIYLDHILLFPSIVPTIDRLGWAPKTGWESLVLCLLVVMPALIAFASMTYYFIERPFMKLRPTRRVIAEPVPAAPDLRVASSRP